MSCIVLIYNGEQYKDEPRDRISSQTDWVTKLFVDTTGKFGSGSSPLVDDGLGECLLSRSSMMGHCSRVAATMPRLRQHAGWLLREVIPAACVLVVALWLFGSAAQRVPFLGDESHYISSARYFGYLFLQPDVTRKEWGDNFATHTQPMLTNYLIGFWLWSHGYAIDDLVREYDWRRTLDENRAQGRVPDQSLLAQARAPMVGIAAGSVVLVYLLGRLLGGLMSGLITGGLAVGSPLVQEYSVRVAPEAPFSGLLLLGLILCILGGRRGREGSLPVGWAVASGVVLGFAIATKLTAAFSVAALLIWGAFVAGLAADATRLGPSWTALIDAACTAGRGWLMAVLFALALFVVSDPHLYPNPILHTAHLIQDPIKDMLEQQRYLPEQAVYSLPDRARFVLLGSLLDGTFTGSRGIPLEAGLAPLGAATLALGLWRSLRHGRGPTIEGLVLLTALVYFAGISLGLMVNYSRYFLPTLLLGTLFSGLGLASMVRRLLVAAMVFKNRTRVIQHATPRA